VRAKQQVEDRRALVEASLTEDVTWMKSQAAGRLEKTKKARLAKLQREHEDRIANLEPNQVDAAEQERRKNLLKSTRAVKGNGLKATMERMKALKASKAAAATAPPARAAVAQPAKPVATPARAAQAAPAPAAPAESAPPAHPDMLEMREDWAPMDRAGRGAAQAGWPPSSLAARGVTPLPPTEMANIAGAVQRAVSTAGVPRKSMSATTLLMKSSHVPEE